MELLKIILSLIGGVMVLSYGAKFFVEAASHIARIFGISPLIIGLTIVSIGTSAPEFAVNIIASAHGNNDIALGNVVGSNIFNIAVIFGICSIITPLVITQQLLKLDIPIMVTSAVICWPMGQDGTISILEGALLFFLFIGYILIQLKLAKDEKKEVIKEYEEAFGEKGKRLPEFIKLLIGLCMLIVGARFFVEGAASLARILGLSEAVIALTIISVGTSLPEVATSVTATLKGEKDIAVGNVVGSNIFNAMGVLGCSALAAKGDLQVTEHIRTIDIPLMVSLSVICLPLALWRQKLDRWVGLLFLLLYGSYVWHLLA